MRLLAIVAGPKGWFAECIAAALERDCDVRVWHADGDTVIPSLVGDAEAAVVIGEFSSTLSHAVAALREHAPQLPLKVLALGGERLVGEVYEARDIGPGIYTLRFDRSNVSEAELLERVIAAAQSVYRSETSPPSAVQPQV